MLPDTKEAHSPSLSYIFRVFYPTIRHFFFFTAFFCSFFLQLFLRSMERENGEKNLFRCIVRCSPSAEYRTLGTAGTINLLSVSRTYVQNCECVWYVSRTCVCTLDSKPDGGYCWLLYTLYYAMNHSHNIRGCDVSLDILEGSVPLYYDYPKNCARKKTRSVS